MSRWLYDNKLQRFVSKPASGAVAVGDVGPIAQDRILGRVSSGSGVAEELTAAQVKTLLDIVGVTAAALAAKAPLASPSLNGTPTAPTAAAGTNTTQISTTAFVQAALAAFVDSAPPTLDTLNELAAALGDDPNFATTMANALAYKQPISALLTAIAALTPTSGYVLTGTGSSFTMSAPAAGASPDIQIFTSSGTWTKPSGKTLFYAIVIGGGGGGGSGCARISASSVTAGGGGGGGGGCTILPVMPISNIPATLAVTVGAGGTGGAAKFATVLPGGSPIVGDAGYTGNASFIKATGSYPHVFAYASGGVGGNGGSSTTTTTGGAGGLAMYAGGAGGSSSSTSSQTVGARPLFAPHGGAGGAYLSGSSNYDPILMTGGSGGDQMYWDYRDSSASNPVRSDTSYVFGFIGHGAAGGTSASPTGANGGVYGSGGGGGAGKFAAVSGAGGNGANGVVVIISF